MRVGTRLSDDLSVIFLHDKTAFRIQKYEDHWFRLLFNSYSLHWLFSNGFFTVNQIETARIASIIRPVTMHPGNDPMLRKAQKITERIPTKTRPYFNQFHSQWSLPLRYSSMMSILALR